jgi:hypothetical protein
VLKYRHLPTGMAITMAVNTNTTSSQGSGSASPASAVAEVSSAGELLDDWLDAEEAPMAPQGKGKTPAQANSDEDEDEALEAELEEEPEDETTSDGEESEEEAGGEDEEAEDESTEEEEETAEEAEDETTDEDLADLPKGMEKLAASKEFKWAAKRLARFTREVRVKNETIAQLGSRIEPSVDHPFADALTPEDLKTAIAAAKQTQQDFGKLKAEDFVEDEKTGELVYAHRDGKVTVHLTKAEIERRLALAAQQVDPEAITARQNFIASRQQSRPWEAAATIAPGIDTPGTWENHVYGWIMGQAKSLRAELPNFEEVLAHAIANKKRQMDTQPSPGFPKGKIKVVEYQLDAKGNVIPPKRAVKKALPMKTAKGTPPATTTSTGRPSTRPDPQVRKTGLRTAARNGAPVLMDDFLDSEGG